MAIQNSECIPELRKAEENAVLAYSLGQGR